MSEAFDPYHRWLGIPPKDQPPHHYRLLGIDLFEVDPEVIRDATERQMAHVRKYQLGQHSAISQKILNELAAAKSCLIDRDKKVVYDAALKAKLTASNSSTEHFDTPSPPPPPAAPPSLAEEPLLPTINLAGKAKTTDLFGLRGSWRTNKNLPFYIGLGTAVILGGILATIYATRGNNQDANILNSNNGLAQFTAPTEENTLKLPAERDMPGKEKPGEQIAGESLAKTPTADDHNTLGDNHGNTGEDRGRVFPITGKKELKPLIPKEPKTDDHQQPKLVILSHPTPESPPKKNKPVSKYKPDSPPSFPASTITLDLPFGKKFNSRLFDVNLKSVENKLEDMLKDKDDIGKVFILHSSIGKSLAEQDKGKLDGAYLAFYNDDIPLIYANYIDGMRNGIFKKWNEDGQRVYWCEYKKGVRHGFCCYFKDDILRMLYEIKFDKIYAIHICNNSELEKSFDSLNEAVADENAKMFIDEVNKIESELKSIETAYKEQIKKEEMRIRQEKAAVLSHRNSLEYQNRINQRRAQYQEMIDTLRHKGGI